jgi:AraC family transcriptional regulator
MLLLRSLQDSTAGNATLHSAYLAKGERENCILWSRARHADCAPATHPLSIRAVWGGAQNLHLGFRTVSVDDDTFLILNSGRVCATSIRASAPVETLTIYFRAGLVEEVQSRLAQTIGRVPEFHEYLQMHEGLVSPVLRYIRAHLARGITDGRWYEEQLLFLLERMCMRECKRQEQIDQLALVRPTTRHEVYRRISLATDYLHSRYAEDIDLRTLAATACLSKFHFLRLFTLIHGTTPRAYLQRKRTDAAVRLLETTQMTISEVAACVGFANASTLLRRVRGSTQLSPRQIRARTVDRRVRKVDECAGHPALSQSQPGEFAIPA